MYVVRIRGLQDFELSFKTYTEALGYAVGKCDVFKRIYHAVVTYHKDLVWRLSSPEGPASIFIIQVS